MIRYYLTPQGDKLVVGRIKMLFKSWLYWKERNLNTPIGKCNVHLISEKAVIINTTVIQTHHTLWSFHSCFSRILLYAGLGDVNVNRRPELQVLKPHPRSFHSDQPESRRYQTRETSRERDDLEFQLNSLPLIFEYFLLYIFLAK